MELLNTENLTTAFDAEKRIAQITYRGTLTSQITSQAYRWLAELSASQSSDNAYGAIFDFSQVTNFQLGNVQTAQHESREINQKFDYSHVPVALIAETPYQEGMIKVSMKLNPQQKRLMIVRSHQEALNFFKDWHIENPRVPADARHLIDDENFRVYYDPQTKLGIIHYRAVITPSITAEAYQWGVKMAQAEGIENVRGGIYDFRKVEEFKQDFGTVRRESRDAHQQVDLSRVPIALVVETLYQEQMVKVSSKITGQEKRVMIVRSIREALQFIDNWHIENAGALP